MTQIGQGDPVSADERQRRVALQRCVKACRVVVPLELGQLPFQIAGMPEQHVVEEFSPHRPDQALHQRVGQRDMRTVLISSISNIGRFAAQRCASNTGS